MSAAKQLEFLKFINDLESEKYLLSVIAYGAAPTIFSSKPSSLLCFQRNSRNLYNLWHRYKDEVCKVLEIDCFALKEDHSSILVLFYRKKALQKCILKAENQSFLQSMGYGDPGVLSDYLTTLKKRFVKQCPHEIGLFLGFPACDVLGFIEHKGQNYLLNRYWKVYNDLDRARIIFSDYDRARNAVMGHITEIIARQV